MARDPRCGCHLHSACLLCSGFLYCIIWPGDLCAESADRVPVTNGGPRAGGFGRGLLAYKGIRWVQTFHPQASWIQILVYFFPTKAMGSAYLHFLLPLFPNTAYSIFEFHLLNCILMIIYIFIFETNIPSQNCSCSDWCNTCYFCRFVNVTFSFGRQYILLMLKMLP